MKEGKLDPGQFLNSRLGPSETSSWKNKYSVRIRNADFLFKSRTSQSHSLHFVFPKTPYVLVRTHEFN